LPADLLVILTTVDGVIEDFGKKNAKTLSLIEKIDAAIHDLAGGTTSETAVGGMKSKIDAAKIAVRSGIPLVIASGQKKDALARILSGKDEGTLFVAQPNRLKGRKRWIAFFHHPKGTLFVDDGAKQALRDGGKSLLPPGVARCEGDFAEGDVIRICDQDGTEFARGIARFSSALVREHKLPKEVLVHRDDLVVL
jgi:glutamate 5-kinase